MEERPPFNISNDTVQQEPEDPHGTGIEKYTPKVPQRSTFRSVLIVVTCTFALVLQTSNMTSVSISLPTIGQDIGIQEDQLQWLVSAYSLSSGCLLLFFGRIADLYGRKKAFIFGSLFQLVFSLGGSRVNVGQTLIILRGFQGLGAAASVPSAVGILAHAFPPSRARSIAFSTFAAGAPIGGAFGMIVGGTVTQLSSQHWRATFYVAAAFSAMCCIGALISFDADKKSTEVDKRLDWIGAVLVTSGLVFIVFVLGQGPLAPQGWKTPYIIALLIVGIFLVASFVVWEHFLEKIADDTSKPRSAWTPPPLMRPSLWTRSKGKLAVVICVAFFNMCGFSSWTFWVQLYYQNYLLLSPVLTMIRFLPMFISGVLCNYVVALLIGRLPLVAFVVFGTLFSAVSCVLFAVINPSVTYWAFGFPSTILSVCGADFVFASGTIFIAKTVSQHEQSVAGALFQTMMQLGTAFGLTISTIVFDSVVTKESAQLGVTLNSQMTNAPASANLSAYKAAQWSAASWNLLASLLGFVFLRSVGVVGHKKSDDTAQPSRSEKHT
ncbi:major facilitator superfamily domain-containing protein [Suillus clintonianus]|uniref:major facilitator superfamily domain-containing protein n=1 Tax=Suillus clintonianus TaxID=1904413 RepID=UPI001B85F085|nr:major facilitator superfamily domain-containing protein [Suillus clintonianus]KAG2132988.1 major facilitator superfamily domain-containing protein [Suillus clintonianus]